MHFRKRNLKDKNRNKSYGICGFNRQIRKIHIFTPGKRSFTQIFGETSILPINKSFIVEKIPVTLFIDESFTKQFIKNGSLQALSFTDRVDMENFIAFLPSGELALYLENEIAESLSLKKEPNCKKEEVKKQRLNFQTCIIDTKLSNFHHGEKLYDLVKSELDKLKDIKFDVYLKWKPEGDICPLSIRDYFEREGYDCSTCVSYCTIIRQLSTPFPNMNLKQLDSFPVEELTDWIGMVICNICDILDSGASKLLQLENPKSPNIREEWKVDYCLGFHDGDEVCRLLKESKKLFEKKPDLPFFIVFLKGYLDSYTAGERFEKFSFEDKIVALIIFPDFQCLVITMGGS
ncbi:uncharacterized protein NPIL_63931 [Nephila pilipes]|uniref:Uncharacterized protein n=1 Tax=Nephila pilipes TaxID=299642 RepID=A0A8X6Q473_NEPPI|nr:uncharacterized protein NPIL_391681 [Nephila pilipes]GFT64519.1 uncharacterized protein NPIL_80601 [Nephila pilipes]GFT99171.1 uncharacterized protein NPIL_63931 [Nephila pilipes]